MQFKRAPVDQILFLRNRANSKLRGCGTLVTSDHGQARFWDLFGPDEPLGSFPLTQNPEEQVVALSTDRENHMLVAGDTAGLIAVFEIKDYCMVTGKVREHHQGKSASFYNYITCGETFGDAHLGFISIRNIGHCNIGGLMDISCC